MTKYKVLAKEIIGLRGAKYSKGNVVDETYFPPGHIKHLEGKSFIEKVKKLSDHSKSEN